MRLSGCQMSKHFCAALKEQVTRLSRQLSAHIIVLAVDAQVPIDADRAHNSLLMDVSEPAESHDRFWNLWQCREGRAGDSRRLVPTGACLVGPLIIVVREVRFSERDNLREGTWPMHL
jgi:hypothetical protein